MSADVSRTLSKIKDDITRIAFIDPVKGNTLKARYANMLSSYRGRGIIGKGEADDLAKSMDAVASPTDKKDLPTLPDVKAIDDIPSLALRRSDGTWLGFVKQYKLMNPSVPHSTAMKNCSKIWREKKKIINRTKVLTDKKTWDLIEPTSGRPISNANPAEGQVENKYEKDVDDVGGAGTSKEGGSSGQITPKIKAWLDKYGDWMIKKIDVGRNPIYSAISSALKLVAIKPFDELFHLYMIVTLEKDGKQEAFILEKNHLVQAYPAKGEALSPKSRMSAGVRGKVDLKTFMSRAERALKPKVFWTYDGFNGNEGTNCQLFVWTCLKANGMGSEALKKFIMQDVKDLVPGWVKTFAKKVTDVAGSVAEKVVGGYSLPEHRPKFKTQPVVKTAEIS